MPKEKQPNKASALIMKNLRKNNLELSQVEMGNRLKVSKSYISQIESGSVDISLSKFYDICKLFKIDDVNSLFDIKPK